MKKSDKSIILMLIGILLAAAAYFLVYKNLTADTEEMQKANAVLEQEVAYLQDLADNKQQYLDDTETMRAKIEEIKAQFPAQYLPEDEILYMINAEDQLDMLARSINMGQTSVIEVAMPTQEAPVATPEDASAEAVSTEETAATPEIMLYKTPVNVAVTGSYLSLKDLIKMINDDENRKSIDNVTIAFDASTGLLLGTMDIGMYSLTGTEAEYTAPKVDGVVYGTNDIFNSAAKKAAVAAQNNAAQE